MDDNIKENIERYQKESYALRYEEEYKGGYGFKNIRSRIIASREIAVLKSLLGGIGIAPGSTILDMPCGTGKLGPALSGYPIRILAADLSHHMMRLASSEYSSGKLLGFMRFDARNVPLYAQSIDHIICLRLFQRLPKEIRISILREFRRVVRRCLVVSYSYYSPFQSLRNSVRRIYDREKQTFYHESLANIESELLEAGFMPRQVRHVLFGASSEIVILAEVIEAGFGQKESGRADKLKIRA